MEDKEILDLIPLESTLDCDARPILEDFLVSCGGLDEAIFALKQHSSRMKDSTNKVWFQICFLEGITHRINQSRVINKSAISNWSQLIAYCNTTMACLSTEQFRIFFLDPSGCVIVDEVHARGTIDHVKVYPREVAKRALELSASSIIIVHNHPTGDPKPSSDDIRMTARVSNACKTVGVDLYDHIIIGSEANFSFRIEDLI